ncbi:hypothetical protein JTT01_19715 [Clostridium botulinum]|nr:hypothetical protein [Clostridium botulinum]MCS4515667.1 hypothetical protein [Clostridium botulinum]MCS4525166.1 hypothetical protein [Clostridium botulinum]MCS4527385.1 hypothetical protein [Clostridium botulinum]
MEDSIDQAEKEAEPILKEGEKSLEIIKNISKDKFEKAANIVIERIVKVNGNS